MTPLTTRNMIVWIFISLAVAIVITLLVQLLQRLAERTLPNWSLADARNRFAKVYPNLDVYQAVSYMLKRDRSFSVLLGILPWQCLAALFMLAAVWAYLIPDNSRFWLSLVQNLFLLQFMILALYPAFRILQKIQRLTIHRLHELLKEK